MKTHLAGELEVLYKSIPKKTELTKVKNSLDIFNFLKEIWDDDIEHRERFYTVYLNRMNKIIGYYMISAGGVAGTIVDPKLVFQPALLLNASSIILAHNHPSGNLTPSREDREMTTKVIQAGKLLDIYVVEHLIVTIHGYFSFRDEGLI